MFANIFGREKKNTILFDYQAESRYRTLRGSVRDSSGDYLYTDRVQTGDSVSKMHTICVLLKSSLFMALKLMKKIEI